MRWALLFLFLFGQCFAQNSSTCRTNQIDQAAIVKYNYDGDTLTLSDGQKIRIIGIDTPELGQGNKPHQAYALTAKQRTKQLIQSSDQHIKLRFDAEPMDKYKRRLAHVFLSNGLNLSAILLSEGLASHISRPPNLNFINCYQDQETSARKKQLGIWQLEQYQTISSDSLSPEISGFRIIQGKILSVKQGKKALLIELPGDLLIGIMKQDQLYFKPLKPKLLADQNITVKGWLHKRSDHFFMRLYHPSAMQFTPGK